MQLNKALKHYLMLGFILCGIACGLFGAFFGDTSNLAPEDIFSTALFIGSILLCLLILKDTRDVKKKSYGKNAKRKFLDLICSEFRLLGKELKSRSTQLGLLAYFLWATSQYMILVLFTDFQIKYTFTVIVMMFGYLMGIAILGFCKRVSDAKVIRVGFLLTIFSFLLFFVMDFFAQDNTDAITIASFIYTMGNAFLSPGMLSLFSKERPIHNQGKGFGLIVSADSSSFLVGSIIVVIVNYWSVKLEYVFLMSFMCFLFSWIPYIKYEKRHVNASRNTISEVQ